MRPEAQGARQPGREALPRAAGSGRAAPPAPPTTSPLGLTPFGAENAAALGGGVGADSPLAGFVETGGMPIAPAGAGGGVGQMGGMGQMGAAPKTGLITATTTLPDTLERARHRVDRGEDVEARQVEAACRA